MICPVCKEEVNVSNTYVNMEKKRYHIKCYINKIGDKLEDEHNKT